MTRYFYRPTSRVTMNPIYYVILESAKTEYRGITRNGDAALKLVVNRP